jgi:hypothetical protein
MAFVLATIGARASAQDAVTEIGVAPAGQNAIELIGTVDQDGFNLTAYGYITYLAGVPSDLLFVEGTPLALLSETAARFTFVATGSVATRAVHENIFMTNSPSTLSIYFNETPSGVTFADPASFAGGTLVVTLNQREHIILNVQEPNVAVFQAFADSTQATAETFSLNGQQYRLGHEGLVYRFTLFGQGFRSSIEPLLAQYFFGANAVVNGDEAEE